MQFQQLDYNKLGKLSKRDLDYLNGDKKLDEFLKYPFQFDAFDQVINNRRKYSTDRPLLVESIKKQYDKFPMSNASLKNVDLLLSENTFTVVTAHQPSLFTGPLYFIFKILSTINLAKKIQSKHPDIKVVPIMILGAEDHDFAEVNHCHIYNQKVSWERDSHGPVGRLNLEGLDDCIDQLFEILGDRSVIKDLKKVIKEDCATAKNYFEFALRLSNRLFGHLGLVVLGMDRPELKSKMIPIFKKEIFEKTSASIVRATQDRLINKDYHAQAHVRDINVFYMLDDSRARIVETEQGYGVYDSDKTWNMEELTSEIEHHPERFSPNVILRPIYQELILPNLAYVGGGGELAYWMERKDQFEAFDVSFPMLVRRNSAMILTKSLSHQIEKSAFQFDDLLINAEDIAKSYLKLNPEIQIENFQFQKNQIIQIYADLLEKVNASDPTLSGTVAAEETKALKGIEIISKKLEKKTKQDHEVKIGRVTKVHQQLFPSNGLQERYANIFQFLSQSGLSIIDQMLPAMDPFDKNMIMIKLSD